MSRKFESLWSLVAYFLNKSLTIGLLLGHEKQGPLERKIVVVICSFEILDFIPP
jgi:hypothetical protein